MPSTLTFTGLTQLAQRLRALEAQTMPALAATLHQQAEAIMAASQELVPVRNRDGGTLRDSGMLFPPEVNGGQVSVTLGYGAPYAEAVHENPRSGKTGGFSPRGEPYESWAEVGEWHFLSTPMEQAQATFMEAIAATVRGLMRR